MNMGHIGFFIKVLCVIEKIERQKHWKIRMM